MTQTPPLPRVTYPPPASNSPPTRRLRNPGRPRLAPPWLQVMLIVALLGAAVYVWLDGWRIWGALLAFAGLAFGASFLLRRMVGDEYGRA